MRTISVLLSTALLSIATPSLAQSDAIVVSEAAVEGAASSNDASIAKPQADAATSNCKNIAYAVAKTAYDFGEVGALAYDKPVMQAGATRACAKGLSVDLWTSTALSTEGAYGDRNQGDEIDLTATYTNTVGTIEYQIAAAYWAVTPLEKIKDDIVMVSGQLAKPIAIGKATLKPYAKAFAWVGLDTFPTMAFVRGGATLDVPLNTKWAVSFDAAHVVELTHASAATKFDITFYRELGHGWSGMLLGRFAIGMRPVVGLGLSKQF